MSCSEQGSGFGKYLLAKTSEGGVRYFHTGQEETVRTSHGTATVSVTSLFAGDAQLYGGVEAAMKVRDRLNRHGIGGAYWHIHYAEPLLSPCGAGR